MILTLFSSINGNVFRTLEIAFLLYLAWTSNMDEGCIIKVIFSYAVSSLSHLLLRIMATHDW